MNTVGGHRMSLALGAARHSVETALWRTRKGARWLLERDLAGLDAARHRPAGDVFAPYEAQHFSQNGEDGIIAHLLEEMGIQQGTFVEIASADGTENCTRSLAEHGWSGVWFEGDPELVERSRELEVAARIDIRCEIVRPDNVDELLEGSSVPDEPEVFVLDIDGRDLPIMAAVLGRYRPRLIVHEYNGEHRYPWSMSARRGLAWSRDWNFGASLQAYGPLLESHGYRLAGCDRRGVNAFWIRGDLVPATVPVGSVDDLFVWPVHRLGSTGHPRRTPLTGTAPPDATDDDLRAVAISDAAVIGSSVRRRGETVAVVAEFENRSSITISSEGEHPFHVAYRIRDAAGDMVSEDEPQRAPVASILRPGDRRPLAVELTAPLEPGEYRVGLCLLQEFVRWGEPDFDHGVTISVR